MKVKIRGREQGEDKGSFLFLSDEFMKIFDIVFEINNRR